MALADAVQGSRHTGLTITWYQADGTTVLDLTNATITGTKRDINTGTVTALDGALASDAPTTGVFTWAFGAVDTGTAGVYEVQFTATFSDDSNKTDTSKPVRWTVYAKNTVSS